MAHRCLATGRMGDERYSTVQLIGTQS